jgi:hypothetical protein
MSETVHYRGILTEVDMLDNETLEEQCKRILGDVELPSYFKSYQEMLLDQFYQTYIIYDNTLYLVEKENYEPDEDIFYSKGNEDGTISFEVKYYNGGCGFNEAIEEALKSIE